VTLRERPPEGWDGRIASPMLAAGFAEASRYQGYSPFFVEEREDSALVLVRGICAPVLGPWTRRARVYVNRGDEGFLRSLIADLRARGVAHVKIGDDVWGMEQPMGWPRLRPIPEHVFVHDLSLPEPARLAQMRDPIPRHIRRAEREGVAVGEVQSDDEMQEFCGLLTETTDRMRRRNVGAVFPEGFFWTIFREMVPRRQAVFLLARTGSTPLAGGVFFLSQDRMTYYHGVSTRDRTLTGKQGPTAMFWHAMRLGQRWGIKTFDMRAVTPTEDPRHPHYSVYAFKRDWGGTLTERYRGEIILAPVRYYFQERVLSPAFDILHPIYMRMVARRSEAAQVAK